MAITTAIAAIGESNPYHGGISPTYLVFLKEGDQPSLHLYRLNLGSYQHIARWIPTVDGMLDDMLLLIAAIVEGRTPLAEQLKQHSPVLDRFRMEDLSDLYRQHLYELVRTTSFRSKIVLTLLEDSYLLKQTGRLNKYVLNCELCISSRAPQEAAQPE